MTAALNEIPLEEVPVLDDDTDTLVSLVGKRVIPILVKDDGTPMLESMHMVDYIEAKGAPVFTGSERPQIDARSIDRDHVPVFSMLFLFDHDARILFDQPVDLGEPATPSLLLVRLSKRFVVVGVIFMQ